MLCYPVNRCLYGELEMDDGICGELIQMAETPTSLGSTDPQHLSGLKLAQAPIATNTQTSIREHAFEFSEPTQALA